MADKKIVPTKKGRRQQHRKHLSSFERLSSLVQQANRNFSVPMVCPECGSQNIFDFNPMSSSMLREKPQEIVEEEGRKKKKVNTYEPGKGGVVEKKRFCYDCKTSFSLTGEFTYSIKEREES